jgi:hypothetical protein
MNLPYQSLTSPHYHRKGKVEDGREQCCDEYNTSMRDKAPSVSMWPAREKNILVLQVSADTSAIIARLKISNRL